MSSEAVLALEALELLEDFPDLAGLFTRPEWHARAACRGIGAEVFFPELGGHGDRARAICRTCPVATECHAQALDGAEAGIWAGTTERERKRRPAA